MSAGDTAEAAAVVRELGDRISAGYRAIRAARAEAGVPDREPFLGLFPTARTVTTAELEELVRHLDNGLDVLERRLVELGRLAEHLRTITIRIAQGAHR